MIRMLIAMFLFVNLSFGVPTVEVVDGTVQTKRVNVIRDGSPASVDVQEERVSIRFQNGTARQADIIMLRDPLTGSFWWRYQEIEDGTAQSSSNAGDPLDGFTVYIAKNRAYGFHFVIPPPSLTVRESDKDYPSMKQGEAAVFEEIQNKIAPTRRESTSWADHSVTLLSALGSDFFYLRNSAGPFPKTIIRSVSRKNGKWHLILEEPNKDSAEVVLSDDYQIVRATHFPAKSGSK